MFAAGVGLGLLCRYLPPQYQAPCAFMTGMLKIFMGVS